MGVDEEESVDSIYCESTPARLRALEELTELLLRVGFKVTKRLPTESTLRVYPEKHARYPLLNPRFFETAADLDPPIDRQSLVFHVYTKRESSIWVELLRSFPSSPRCVFIEDGKQGKIYFHHGWFILPLEFEGDPINEVVAFPKLEEPLTRMFLFLNRQSV